ncbi:hypothetical protein [Bathymodiolus japonicus methanotrophic gill symbiont]|uniref:hypothetical protein n=1 Tax=Bathymodiolus japonicus methanotrophic gill symbiont TaxID=113269 RepID=UPI003B839570
MLSFKGTHFQKDVILYAVFFYVRYGVSYRDLEEITGSRYFCESLFWASQPKQAAKT